MQIQLYKQQYELLLDDIRDLKFHMVLQVLQKYVHESEWYDSHSRTISEQNFMNF